MNKILIVGYGFVGSAVGESLKNEYEVLISDPAVNTTKVSDYPDVSGIILCLPTPQGSDGSCDVSYLHSVLTDCPPSIPLLIKSTMSIEGYTYLRRKFSDLDITYSPEFLTAANAKQDFKEQSYYYLAGDSTNFWVSIFSTVFPGATAKISDSVEELILVKYFRNSFLSVKVAYANQMYDACIKLNIDYDSVRNKFGEDPRIGSSHTLVPGPDGERGFGGACFPKDTAAMLHTAEEYDLDISIIKAAVDYNNKLKED
jgi:UDPglucose 6-dehydrogenase